MFTNISISDLPKRVWVANDGKTFRLWSSQRGQYSTTVTTALSSDPDADRSASSGAT